MEGERLRRPLPLRLMFVCWIRDVYVAYPAHSTTHDVGAAVWALYHLALVAGV